MRGCNLTVSIDKMTDSTPLRIKRIEVEGLFGLYHHLIDLNLEDRVTILHGSNGVGKTVLLRMINAIFNNNYLNYFYAVPFNKFSMEFTDGRLLSTDEYSIRNNHSHMVASFGFARFDLDLSRFTRDYQFQKDISKKSAYFIEDQRLFYCSRVTNAENQSVVAQMTSVLSDYARDLHEQIRDAIAGYGLASQELDRTLPQRLLNKTTSQVLGSEQLKQQLIELESKYGELREIGLLQETVTPVFDVEQLNNIDEAKRGMMTLYIEDTQQKLSVLDNFAQRIKLFLDIINHKFKLKHIKIDHEKGFVIEALDFVIDNIRQLDLKLLSSGEQHEVVLTYDLLFKTVPNSLVLIDEPELSLHLTWQGHFLPDLLKIVKVANFDVIIATHSPFIIGNRRDLMVALEDKVQ